MNPKSTSTLATNMRSRARNESSIDTPPTTPTPISTSAHQLLSNIRSIYHELSGLSSLAPCKQVNTLLTRLVNLCITPYDPDFISCFFSIEEARALCYSLQLICATAEGELERFWARKILDASISKDSAQTKAVLSSFPYHRNYLDLSRLEASLLITFLSGPNTSPQIAFIGSGPLPLTSYCLLDAFPSSIIHNIDRDASALQISQDLTNRLGISNRMTFSCEDVSISTSTFMPKTRWSTFDVVFLAALVGMDASSKLYILKSLAEKLRPGTLVVARSARGLRSVLYPVLELGDGLGNAGYEVLAEVHPWTSVVNSVVVLKVKVQLHKHLC